MKKTDSTVNYLYWFPILIGLLFRLINVQAPIVGIHSWRQADTAAMARHFALEGTPIWLPQIDWAGASAGYVDCEFPLYPYLVGQLYKLFGLHEWIGRGLSIFFSILTIFLVIRIGTRIFDPQSGWWGGLFFAILPLNIYYGRTFQAESLLILLAAISIDRLLDWKSESKFLSLLLSWLAFCLACLIKLLPIFWLGLPLLALHLYGLDKNHKRPKIEVYRRFYLLLSSPYVWCFGLSAIVICLIWFRYSYGLGSTSGFSFFLWGKDTDRFSLTMLFDIQVWSNLLLRITLRNLSIFGLPLVVFGFMSCRQEAKGQTLQAGIVGMFICTVFAMRSSSVHEYYQLPLQLFLCPLMGRGWICFESLLSYRRLSKVFLQLVLALITAISLVVLSFDYYLVERSQAAIWMPLANNIREEVQPQSRIVSVTGLDPTLLNLARRQGWLTSAKKVNKDNLNYWYNQGAEYIVGSLKWQETYIKLEESEGNHLIEKFNCNKELSGCPNPPNYTYFIPLKKLIN
ncbi:ArnT family glycosyltransferase [Prochlorococcus sp. MIT 1307]|uniref:ArnT family glycosyltransferase n=1 Tax=Prochlorococcus sp. MIT 1307 TaxID=3096219 RepID=UPI002A765F24|nr:glycosyltransferase family 39 protein [Prochlorococcus sp. MIT 1307]